MGVEIQDQVITSEDLAAMESFVYDYLQASVQNKDEGGRMRWYPWHSADYRYNHSRNVMALGRQIAEAEGADPGIVQVAALFHDVAKLDAEQDVHAREGARIARQYLETHGNYAESFINDVCRAIERHAYQGSLLDLDLETRSLMEADMLDKVGANGAALILLRTGYEARSHMRAAEMVDRVLERGREAVTRIESETAESIAHQRLKRVKWFRDWLIEEVAEMEADVDEPLM